MAAQAPRRARIHLRASDVMTSPVITVRPDTTAKDVAAVMLTHHISGLPVVTVEGELVGIVTEGDLLHKEATAGARPRARSLAALARRSTARKAGGITAADLMSAPVVTVNDDTALAEIAALMVRRQINRVPVLRAGRVAGIVSRADVIRALVRADDEIAALVRDTLLHDLWLDVDQIHIDVRQGIIYLDGTVERRSEQALVERWVAAIDGVIGVESRLTYRFDDRRGGLGDLWPEPRVGGAR